MKIGPLKHMLFIVIGFLFSSCMHAVMMGGHDSHDSMEPTIVTKEVARGAYTIAVTLPPMEVKKETAITLNLRSTSGTPDSVFVHYMISEYAMEGSSGHDHSMKEDSEGFKPIHQTVPITNGTATINYTPTTPGRFTFSIEATVDSIALSTELNFMVHGKKGQGTIGMMGMGADWEYPIIGVLAMGVMMITMWAVRGGF